MKQTTQHSIDLDADDKLVVNYRRTHVVVDPGEFRLVVELPSHTITFDFAPGSEKAEAEIWVDGVVSRDAHTPPNVMRFALLKEAEREEDPHASL